MIKTHPSFVAVEIRKKAHLFSSFKNKYRSFYMAFNLLSLSQTENQNMKGQRLRERNQRKDRNTDMCGKDSPFFQDIQVSTGHTEL